MPNTKNKEQVKVLQEKLTKAKSLVFTDYLGIKANEVSTLRQKMKDNGAELMVAKNSLLKVALKETNNPNTDKISKDLEQSTAVVFSYKDAIAPIKAIFDFAKNLEFPKIKSAIIENTYFDTEQVQVIKTLPTKEILLTRLVVSLKSPISGFVTSLAGLNKKFVYAINAIAKKKGGEN
jgi:large subunit ribosomal protein L10